MKREVCWKVSLELGRSSTKDKLSECGQVTANQNLMVLEGRQEPQASSLFLTPTLRPQGPCRVGSGELGLVLSEEGTPLASRVAQGVSGPTSSCVWNPRVFLDDARECQCPFVLCHHPQGCLPDARGESVLVSRGSEGLRSPLELRRVSLGAH